MRCRANAEIECGLTLRSTGLVNPKAQDVIGRLWNKLVDKVVVVRIAEGKTDGILTLDSGSSTPVFLGPQSATNKSCTLTELRPHRNAGIVDENLHSRDFRLFSSIRIQQLLAVKQSQIALNSAEGKVDIAGTFFGRIRNRGAIADHGVVWSRVVHAAERGRERGRELLRSA
ncbi:uncharacterized protein BCR38DRAFT_407197 [Pseudomassariella vexata]|uniref:Uncharacterized protein n=1 Tax=Pseudomassariella vexata TaxID=1141098 RepID=A0A1Y2E8K4_9PEZI|nr:uncharacterized protein BCR38DRAFT_407197 [Pseudomassariella vexata]ORY67195.1 hypothetical protein BCR38DRAFT_407197 [Pseudomassariella vexata]